MLKPVKIITDSASDIPQYVATELDIAVIPLTVKFRKEAFLDGIDISITDFYAMLLDSYVMPTILAPSPVQFLEEYKKAEKEGRDVLSIHISSKLSETYNAALLAKEQSKSGVEVMDSQQATMGLGLIAIWAAKRSREGAELQSLLEEVKKAQSRIRVLAVADTLMYLQKGGRIGLAQAVLGSILSIKPVLSLKNGKTFTLERVRTKTKALARLCEICQAESPYEELSILYSTTPDEAEKLLNEFASIFPREKIYKARFGPILGSYLGPGALGAAYIKSK